MAPAYRIDVLTPAGIKVAEFTSGGWGFLGLAYSKRLNEPGQAKVVLHGLNPRLARWADRGQVEIWRSNKAIGLDWYCDFRGLFLAQRLERTTRDLATLTIPGAKWILGTRIVAWYANTAGRSAFSNAKPETIAKTLVNYNLGSAATTGNGRVRTGTPSWTTVTTAPDLARGTNLDWYCAWDNLLTTLQKLSTAAGFDFELNKSGPNSWEFEYYPALGVDRTAVLSFSLERDNVVNPVYERDRTEEATVAIVGGKGDNNLRAIRVVTGPDYAADNDSEIFVAETNYPDGINPNSTLDAAGARALEETRTRETFSYEPRQTRGAYYGLDYCVGGVLGDLVRSKFRTVEATQRVVGVTVSADPQQGAESIEAELQTLA